MPIPDVEPPKLDRICCKMPMVQKQFLLSMRSMSSMDSIAGTDPKIVAELFPRNCC